MTLSQVQQASFDEMSMAEKISILLLQLGEDTTSTSTCSVISSYVALT